MSESGHVAHEVTPGERAVYGSRTLAFDVKITEEVRALHRSVRSMVRWTRDAVIPRYELKRSGAGGGKKAPMMWKSPASDDILLSPTRGLFSVPLRLPPNPSRVRGEQRADNRRGDRGRGRLSCPLSGALLSVSRRPVVLGQLHRKEVAPYAPRYHSVNGRSFSCCPAE